MRRAREAGTVLVPAFLLVAWTPGAASAQSAARSPLSLELRGGAAVPMGSFASGPREGGKLGAGAALTVRFAYDRSPRTGVTVGFTQARFDCSEDGCPGGEYVSTGWEVGFRWRIVTGAAEPWLQAGVRFDRVEGDFAVAGGVERRLSELATGGEVGAGLSIPLRDPVVLVPGVRWVASNTRFPDEDLLRVRYWLFDVGLALVF